MMREVYALALTQEQLASEVIFQCFDCMANGALREMQFTPGLREAPTPSQRNESAKLACIEWMIHERDSYTM